MAFREATLVLSDPKNESALSHWSLPAVERLNPGEIPAVYAPGEDATETLELDDGDMIAALETVRSAVEGQRAKPGRLRGFILGAGTVLVVGLGAYWLPDALITHTASVLPDATRVAIGQAALADVQRLTGSPCTTPLGTFALTALSDRLFGQHKGQILILREGVRQSAHLPGGVVLIGRKMLESHDSPEVLAGLALIERLRADTRDPILPLLQHAGLTATFRLLTSGALPAGALDGYGEAFLQSVPVAVPDEQALDRFRAAGISSSPYAYALDPTGESTIGLIEADPLLGLVPEPLMPDGDWVSLQDICAGQT